MNKDEQANRFIGHVETKEKEESGEGERKCVARRREEGRDGNRKKGILENTEISTDEKEFNNRML